MKRASARSAFTMIELLFVIVIMGIVGSFAIEAIRQYYEGIYRTQTITQRTAQADHLLEQVSKYFENALSGSIVNLDVNTTTGNCKIPDEVNDGSDYTVAFIAVDADSLRGLSSLPGWSEDVNISGNTMTGFGVEYNASSTITTALNGGGDLSNSAVFNNSQNAANNGGCSDYRLNTATTDINQTKFLQIVAVPTSTTLNLHRPLDDGNKQKAYLFRSAYAFRVDTNGDFFMYSNIQPWKGERYNDSGVNKRLLAQNVAHFYADYNTSDFQSNVGLNDRGLVWRLKVCMRGIKADLTDSNESIDDICRERRVHVRY